MYFGNEKSFLFSELIIPCSLSLFLWLHRYCFCFTLIRFFSDCSLFLVLVLPRHSSLILYLSSRYSLEFNFLVSCVTPLSPCAIFFLSLSLLNPPPAPSVTPATRYLISRFTLSIFELLSCSHFSLVPPVIFSVSFPCPLLCLGFFSSNLAPCVPCID